jgi:hypothetical protein
MATAERVGLPRGVGAFVVSRVGPARVALRQGVISNPEGDRWATTIAPPPTGRPTHGLSEVAHWPLQLAAVTRSPLNVTLHSELRPTTRIRRVCAMEVTRYSPSRSVTAARLATRPAASGTFAVFPQRHA